MGQFGPFYLNLCKNLLTVWQPLFPFINLGNLSINLQKTSKQKNKPNEPFLRKKLDEWVAETTTGRSHKRTDAKKQMPWQTEYFWTKQNYPKTKKRKSVPKMNISQHSQTKPEVFSRAFWGQRTRPWTWNGLKSGKILGIVSKFPCSY